MVGLSTPGSGTYATATEANALTQQATKWYVPPSSQQSRGKMTTLRVLGVCTCCVTYRECCIVMPAIMCGVLPARTLQRVPRHYATNWADSQM